MRFTPAHNFMKDNISMYPDKLYLRSDMKYVEIKCKTAYKFAALRKLLVKAWEVSADGP